MTVGQFGYSLGLSGSSALVSLFTIGQVSNNLSEKGGSGGSVEWQSITSYLQDGSTKDQALAVLSRAEVAAIYTNSFRLTAVILGVLIAIGAGTFYFLMRHSKVDHPVEPYCETMTLGAAARS